MYGVLGIDAEPFVLQNRTVTGQFFAWFGTVIAAGIVIGSPDYRLLHLEVYRACALPEREARGSALPRYSRRSSLYWESPSATSSSRRSPSNSSTSLRSRRRDRPTSSTSCGTSRWSRSGRSGIGVLFELPVVVYFLSKIGLLTPALLRHFRKYALIIVLVLGAFPYAARPLYADPRCPAHARASTSCLFGYPALSRSAESAS